MTHGGGVVPDQSRTICLSGIRIFMYICPKTEPPLVLGRTGKEKLCDANGGSRFTGRFYVACKRFRQRSWWLRPPRTMLGT